MLSLKRNKLVASKKVTNDVLSEKLDNVLEALREHREAFKVHVTEDKKVHEDVTILRTIEEGRRWQIRTLWTLSVSAVLGLLAKIAWPQ
jgi:hypothetical protein